MSTRLDAIRDAVAALDSKLDAVLRRMEAGGRAPRERDPGDAVPPGVAVQTPEPLSEADEAVLHKLEQEGAAGHADHGPGAPDGGEADEDEA